jgi:hypothetical protein
MMIFEIPMQAALLITTTEKSDTADDEIDPRCLG